MSKIFLSKVQRFSLHDGPGIRTTVFLKGCSLRCPWCCNPENLEFKVQEYRKDKEIGCYGCYYEIDELYEEIMKDEIFYEARVDNIVISNADDIENISGGVTFSGGECLLQIDNLKPLLAKLHEKKVHTAVETCLFIPGYNLKCSLSLIDMFYVDIKILDKYKCEEILKGDIEIYLRNLDILMKSGKPVVFRIPVIGGFTDDDCNRKKVVELIKKYIENDNLLKIELIKEHNLGLQKYYSLKNYDQSIIIPEYKGVSDTLMEMYKGEISREIKANIPVEICMI